MKVVFSLPVYWPAIGGCEFLTHELVHLLADKEDIEVSVITQITDQQEKTRAPLWYNTTCLAGKKGRSYSEDGVEINLLGLDEVTRRIIYPVVRYHHRFQKISLRVLIEAFRGQFLKAASGSEIVHCIHNGLSYFGKLSLAAARKMGVPFVFSPTLHLFQEGWHEEMMKAIRDDRDFRYIPQLHLRPRGYHDRFWVELCREADALVTWTGFERDFLADLGVPREKIFAFRLGPIITRAGAAVNIQEKFGINEHAPTVLFLGRNHELKGIEDILKAAPDVWSSYPEALFLFVGPKEGRSEEIFRSCKDERVIVIDEVTDDEKVALIDRCDVFCVPSLHESFGIVFLEAWYHGKPIIAADIPPLRELNPDEGGGLLIRPVPGEIAGAVLTLLDDEELRARKGEWGRNRVDTSYRWDKAGDRLVGIYESLLDG
jgi:glycosyltransferase involved in cell wall biosynthesis